MKVRHYVPIVIFSVFFLAVLALGRWMRPYDLRNEQAAARAAGIPLTPAEFPQVEPPADQNAVPIYLELGQALQTQKLDDAKVWTDQTDMSGTVPKQQTAAMKALLESRRDLIRLVHAAVARPHAFVRHDEGNVEWFQFLVDMGTSASWIRWESIVLAREGRSAEAIKHQALGFRIANQAAEDPSLIAYLVGLACEEKALKGFADILSEAGPDAAVADAVHREISTYQPTYNLTRCQEGELIEELAEVHQIGSVHDLNVLLSPTEVFKPSGHKPSGLFRWYYLDPAEAIYLHWTTARIQAARAPMVERMKPLSALQAEFDRAPANMPTYKLSKTLVTPFSKPGEREIDLAARRAAVIAMADVMAYRARHGRWPATITEAANPPPLDPRTGKPIAFRLEGTGFVISPTPAPADPELGNAETLRRKAEIHYPPLKPKPLVRVRTPLRPGL